MTDKAVRIELAGVSWEAGGRPILHTVTARVEPGETVGLIGPNGSGKSTLLRCAAGLRAPTAGAVRYDGQHIGGWSARRIARRVAFVEQTPEAESDLRVDQVVALGRTPFRDRWRGLTATDDAIIDAALERLDLGELRTRPWRTLSGGERQRAHLARALAQRPWGLLLDEPTNHLDIRHQLELMELLAATGQTVLVALHDLTLAARYCDRLLLLHGGALVAAGTPEEVLTPDRLREVFRVAAEVGRDGLGNPAVAYRGVSSRDASDTCEDTKP
ncbi:ABC transporter ATP-binding protein [Streptomyces litchfieldiae]|uniref:ABC transporter ATP-binding protein n=1 Tax=Streptomyces litchfieldiae TaxID=3075543 RepID=A0ABU2MVQ6_9ACTN|nr:ABC transporter ATP-binding protein [Streptomyces sp. DSM 44938]MDT0345725.1 ABC transporter ATP-binding protein [Streptomyces sp. DSM 44938]